MAPPLSFQAFVAAQLEELGRRLVEEYERHHGGWPPRDAPPRAPQAQRDERHKPSKDAVPSAQAQRDERHKPSKDAVPSAQAHRDERRKPSKDALPSSQADSPESRRTELQVIRESSPLQAYAAEAGRLQLPGDGHPDDREDTKELSIADEFAEHPKPAELRVMDINMSFMKSDRGEGIAYQEGRDIADMSAFFQRAPSEHSSTKHSQVPSQAPSKASHCSMERPRRVGMDLGAQAIAETPVHSPNKSPTSPDAIVSAGMEGSRRGRRPSGSYSNASNDIPKSACSKDYVVYPGSMCYRLWSNFISMLVLFSCFLTPMRFGFNASFETFDLVDSSLDIFFALDILLTFNVALHTKDGMVTRRRVIFVNYVLSPRFWIDLFATVPIDTIWEKFVEPTTMNVRIQSGLGLLRLLRVNRLLILFRELQANTYFNLMGVVVAKFVLFILLCTHTSGCIFYALATFGEYDANTWVYRVNPDMEFESLATRYAHVLFWAVGTFKAGPAHGDLTPTSNTEMLWACLTMMVNICLQTYLVSNMAALLTTTDVRIYAMRNQLRQLQDFCLRYRLPADLRRQLGTLIRFKFATDQELDQNVLSGLPELYRQRISHVLFEEIVARVDIFKDCAPLFLRQLHGGFKSTLYMPDQHLTHIDEPATLLQIIAEGEADMFHRGGSTIDACRAGECFSAVSFLCRVGQPFSVKTKNVCRVLSLDHAAWDAASAAFPENLNQVKLNLLRACEEKADEFMYGTSGHIIYSELTQIVQANLVQQRENSIAVLCSAAARGDIAELKRILAVSSPDCANPDARTPLHLAAANGRVEAIGLLIENNARHDCLDNFGRTPLLEACRSRQEAAAQLLSASGAKLGAVAMRGSSNANLGGSDANSDDENSKAPEDEDERERALAEAQMSEAGELCQAASDVEQLWYLRALLKYGANPNAGDYDARTALHVACACGNTPAVQLLIGRPGINLDPRDNFGRTPLMEAVRHGHEAAARIMKGSGAFHGFVVNLKDNDDANAIPAGQELCQAAFANQVTYLHNLITYCGIDVDASDYDLRTALMLACAEGNMQVAVSLVQNGADIHRKDRWGHTPISEARDHGHGDLAAVLTQMGKQLDQGK